MFFIGSTGPILTFLLTFLLPLFLLTAKPNGNSGLLVSDIPVTLKTQSYTQITNIADFHVVIDKPCNISKTQYLGLTVNGISKKYPGYSPPIKNYLINLNYSGNKAPPVFC